MAIIMLESNFQSSRLILIYEMAHFWKGGMKKAITEITHFRRLASRCSALALGLITVCGAGRDI